MITVSMRISTLAPLVASLALTLGLAVTSGAAQAQAYPSRPVRVIVPFSPGGPSDLIGRLTANALQDALGQNFLVENRVGAGGNVGTAQIAKAPPDGYTLLVTGTSQFTVNPYLYKTLSYELKDFTLISQLAVAPSIFVIHPDRGIKTIREFVDYAKANAGKLNVGNSGMGSPPHIASELLMAQAGITYTQVPYTGASLAVQAVLGKSIDASSTAVPPAQALVESGRLTGLAVTGTRRWPGLPNVPTMMESGYPEFAVESIFALYGPAGMPPEIVQRLSTELANGFGKPEVREKILATGFEARAAGPDALRARINADAPKFKALIEKAGIPLQ